MQKHNMSLEHKATLRALIDETQATTRLPKDDIGSWDERDDDSRKRRRSIC